MSHTQVVLTISDCGSGVSGPLRADGDATRAGSDPAVCAAAADGAVAARQCVTGPPNYDAVSTGLGYILRVAASLIHCWSVLRFAPSPRAPRLKAHSFTACHAQVTRELAWGAGWDASALDAALLVRGIRAALLNYTLPRTTALGVYQLHLLSSRGVGMALQLALEDGALTVDCWPLTVDH